ncbi:hypothetical protein DFH11DRAFT_672326 [Phellopilus nigrolimitatus]|nr:hypothetical protein DFH11DRAFT_672326 [Phellopilus nigrolimitatus]
MVKQRKQKASSKAVQPETEGVSESEQWRIIEQSGVLKNIPRDTRSAPLPPAGSKAEEESDDEPCSPLCSEIFNAILFIIPFSSLYIMMDILAHRQYAHAFTTAQLIEKVVYGIPLLSLFIFYTTRHKAERRMQALLFLLSVGCGSRLIYVVNWANWQIVMRQCPPLGTIWIYTVAQLDLAPAVAALGTVAAFVKWKDLNIIF